MGHKGQFWWQSRSGSPLPDCRSEPLRQATQCRHGFHPIEARMDRSASSDCSFLKKRRGERNPVRGGTFIDDVVKIFEIDPTSDSSPWGRRASASLQPGETTFDADQTAREFWPGKTPTRAPTLSEFQRYMVERIKAYFQVRWRCVRPLYSVTIAGAVAFPPRTHIDLDTRSAQIWCRPALPCPPCNI